MRFSHLSASVVDLDRMVAFYRDGLGFRAEPVPERPGAPHAVEVSRGDLRVVLAMVVGERKSDGRLRLHAVSDGVDVRRDADGNEVVLGPRPPRPGEGDWRFDRVLHRPGRFDRAVAFWEALGMRVTARWGEEGEEGARLEHPGGLRVTAAKPRNEAEAAPRGGALGQRYTVEVRVPDVDGARAALPEAVKVLREPEDGAEGGRWALLQDPEGNVWALRS